MILKILTWVLFILSIMFGIMFFIILSYIDINNIIYDTNTGCFITMILICFLVSFWSSVICAMYDKNWEDDNNG